MLRRLADALLPKKKLAADPISAESLESSGIKFTLKRRRGAKIIRISVGPKGVVVSAPDFCRSSDAARLVAEKAEWIEKAVLEFEESEGRPEHSYLEGEELLIFGVSHRIRIAAGAKNEARLLEDGGVLLHLKKDSGLEERRRAVLSMYRRLLEEHLQKRVPQAAAQTGLECRRLVVRSMKRSWGRFRKPRYEMVMALRLIHRTKEEIDYVIHHELAHSAHMNHGPKFKNLLKTIFPAKEAMEASLKIDRNPYKEDA